MGSMGRLVDKALAIAERRGIRAAEVARAAGISPARITEWKGGQGGPTLRVALRIARFLETSLDYLADDQYDVPPPWVAATTPESRAIELVRSLGLDVDDVYRGLTAAATWRDRESIPQQPVHHGAVAIPPQDEHPPKGRRSG